MTKLYFVRTNAYDMIISDDGEIRRVIDSTVCDIYAGNSDVKCENALRILQSIEDDSSWDIYEESVEDLTRNCEVLAEIEW